MKKMMKNLFLVCAYIVMAQTVLAQDPDYSVERFRSIGLPLIEVVTVDSVMPTCDYVEAPEGSLGRSIINATKVPGRLVMTLQGDTLYDSGNYVKDESGITININGNTSAYSPDKPYKLKLQVKDDLLLRGDSALFDKEWRLLRDDRQLYTDLGLKISELVGMAWTPRCMYCNVFVNGQYQGLYQLCESVKRNKKCRLDVSKTGYIIERDAYWWKEDRSFATSFFNTAKYRWTFKYPDSDEVTDEQMAYISQQIKDLEASIQDGTYPEHIDVESLAAWLLAHDIMGTWDAGGTNIFVLKYDDTPESKLEMGCLWDFGSLSKMGSSSWSRFHMGNEFYCYKLLLSSNNAFRRAYYSKWDELKNTINADLQAFLDSIGNSPTVPALNESRRLHVDYHDGMMYTVENNVTRMKGWFDRHITWMKNAIDEMQASVTEVPVSSQPSPTYNLQGMQVPADNPGIVINRGRKIKN